MTIWGRQTRHEIQIACVLRHLVVRRGIRWYFIWLPALTFIKNSTGHVLFLDIGPAHTWKKKPISRFRKHSLLNILPNTIEGWIEYSEGEIGSLLYTYILKSSSACKTGLSAFCSCFCHFSGSPGASRCFKLLSLAILCVCFHAIVQF